MLTSILLLHSAGQSIEAVDNLIIGEGKTMSIRGVNVFLRWVRWVMLYR